MTIYLRKMQQKDLINYETLNHPDRLFHEFNGPYFKRETLEELRQRISKMNKFFDEGKNVKEQCRMIINEDDEDLIGEVSWYWKSEETNWMEIGICIYNENYWGLGIGYEALYLWIDYIFSTNTDIVRLGLTTWSGNERMMKLAEKLGMKQESCYRMARFYNNKYYDSVSFGILRSEWENKDLIG